MRAARTRVSRMASEHRERRTRSVPEVAAYPSVNSRYSTPSTAGIRSGSRCGGGTRKGIPALRILRLARTRRCDIVASETRNTRAISAVVKPRRERSVSATRASRGSAGWQQVKISLRRSSGKAPSASSFSAAPSARASRASSRSFAAPTASLRSRSWARLRATEVSHAPGRRGIPSTGQRSRAEAKASWVLSSERSQSPVIRIRVATIWPHSSRKALATTDSASEVTIPRSASPRPSRTSRRDASRPPRGPRRGRRTRSG